MIDHDFARRLAWTQTEETAIAVNEFLRLILDGDKKTDDDGWVTFQVLKFREDPEAPGMLWDVQSPDGAIHSWGAAMVGAAVAQTIIMARLGEGVENLKKESEAQKQAENKASLN